MKRLAVFASGSGTNAEAIMTFFEANPQLGQVVAVVSNNKNAQVLQRAANHKVAHYVYPKSIFYNEPQDILNTLSELKVDWIILAGFMLLVHSDIISKYNNKIINIHPALLPKYGGKGMYGHQVHEAVVAAKEKESGITIHYVNNKYDDGAIIFQTTTPLSQSDSAEDVASKIHLLEQEHYPIVIAQTINKTK